MKPIEVGDKAPLFTGMDQDGNMIRLEDFQGKRVILYFYPKDNTPGCTAEACNLNDNLDMWVEKGYQIIGVSPDSVASHQRFRSKHGLEFPLVADTEKEVLQAYGAWGEKKMYGKTYMGVLRTTFVINEQGLVAAMIKKVKTKDHTNQLLKELNLG